MRGCRRNIRPAPTTINSWGGARLSFPVPPELGARGLLFCRGISLPRRLCLKHLCLALGLLSLALPAVLAAAPVVTVTLGDQGLSSLQCDGQEMLWLSPGDREHGAYGGGAAWVSTVTLRGLDGKETHLDNGGPSELVVEPAVGRMTRTFAWGRVMSAFAAQGNTLRMTLTVANKSPASTIEAITLQPLWLRFPHAPREYDGNTPIYTANLGSPSILGLDYGSGTMALCNDDVQQPLLIGFPFAQDRPASTIFPLRVSAGPADWLRPYSDPYLIRPIPPGKSDTYTLSLRFGAAGTPPETLAPDLERKFAATYPPSLRWPDRRPLGYLMLSSTVPHPADGTNQRGWFNNDKSIDVTTDAGRAAFAKQLMAYADNSIRILKAMNAQGMITWDVEGQEFPHATSYIGDPRIVSARAPEMDALADAYFARFRQAGLRVGVCIRPQILTQKADGSYYQRDQTDMAQVTQTLIDKALYANKRWGCTIFYVDSNGDPNMPYPATVFQNVAKALSQHKITALLMPEHKNVRYYAYTAPYAELRGGNISTPERIRRIYPQAFTVLNVSDGDMETHHDELVAAVKRGDILLFRAWWDDPYNAKVKAVYAEAGQPSRP